MTNGNAERESLRAALIARLSASEGAVRGRVLRLDFGPPTGHVVQFRVTGPDADTVRGIATQVSDVMREEPATRDVELQWGDQAKAVRFEIDQDRARALGISSSEVALTLQTLLSGAPVTALRDGNRLAEVVVRAMPEERAAVDRLGDITVATRNGASVPLSQIARETVIAREPILWRRNGEVVLSVRSDVVDGAQGPDVTAAILPRLAPLIAALPAGTRITAGGAVEESAKANAALVA